MYTKQNAITQINEWGRQHKPFFFLIDFELNTPVVYPIDAIPRHIKFDINGQSNSDANGQVSTPFTFETNPISFKRYTKAFTQVINELGYGNSYLLNLTFPTELTTSLDLETIYNRSKARYKLLVDNQFVTFSPESFIKIENGIISSYPMKGTIDASVANAEQVLLNDPKEQAEHVTIVDLIRNDLSKIATNVHVSNYRYIEKIKTFKHDLLQTSSKIEGEMPSNYQQKLGDILFSLLPAGSISGAPKKKTTEIIKKTELKKRGYFTGIFGIFNGKNLDSGVIIRYIEQQNNKMVFKSGSGITAQSNVVAEYQELIDKVYVPFV